MRAWALIPTLLAWALFSGWLPAQASKGSADELGAVLTRYLEALGALRGGDPNAALALEAQAEILARDHARPDAREVARYYLELSPADRAQGLVDEDRVLELRERFVQAGRVGTPAGSSWSELRAELIAELEELARQIETRADFAPAARAHALLARLILQPAGEPVDLERCEQHIQRSLELYGQAGQLTPQLEPRWVQACLERARGDVHGAGRSFHDTLELATRLGRDAQREQCLLGLVDLAWNVGDLRGVERHLAELASFRAPAGCWPLAREHARNLIYADQPEEALASLLTHRPLEAGYQREWHALLATCYLRSGDVLSARREVDAIGGGNGEIGRLAAARLALMEGDAQEARDRLDQGRDIEQFSTQGRVQAAVLLGECWLADGDAGRAVAWLEDAADQAQRWRSRVGDDAGGGSVIGEWIGVHAVVLLARARARSGDALGAALALETLQSGGLRRGFADELTREGLAAWAAAFPAGLVTFAFGADAGVVVHVDASGQAKVKAIDVGRRALSHGVRRLREAVIAGDERRARRVGGELCRSLLPAEILERLDQTPVGSELLLSLHGPVEALPWAALPFEDESLDQRFTLLCLPGLPGARPGDGRRDWSQLEWNLLGNPHADGGSEPLLPGTSRELAAAARALPRATLLSGSAFVGDALTDALRSGRALHVSTHLLESTSCGDSYLSPVGLLLSAGEVYCAERILQEACELPLVVLTTCESGGGRFVDGEGLFGVGRAFLETGTRNLLVTLWPIEDEVGRLFAEHFHQALLQGQGPAQAARAARGALRELGRPAVDWAAFRLLGHD